MQKTKQFTGLFHWFTTGKSFHLAASLLILTAASLFAGEPKDENAAEFSSVARLEKQTSLRRDDAFLLVRENLRSNKSVCVQAGYGRVWGDDVVLRKIDSDRPEPGCAYVKASFSF